MEIDDIPVSPFSDKMPIFRQFRISSVNASTWNEGWGLRAVFHRRYQWLLFIRLHNQDTYKSEEYDIMDYNFKTENLVQTSNRA